MKYTAFLFASIATLAYGSSDERKLIRGGGVAAEVVEDTKTDAGTKSVLKYGANYFEAVAQGILSSDVEGDSANSMDAILINKKSTNPCPACAIVDGDNQFCGETGVYPFLPPCDYSNDCNDAGLECRECSTIGGFSGDVGAAAYRCV